MADKLGNYLGPWVRVPAIASPVVAALGSDLAGMRAKATLYYLYQACAGRHTQANEDGTYTLKGVRPGIDPSNLHYYYGATAMVLQTGWGRNGWQQVQQRLEGSGIVRQEGSGRNTTYRIALPPVSKPFLALPTTIAAAPACCGNDTLGATAYMLYCAIITSSNARVGLGQDWACWLADDALVALLGVSTKTLQRARHRVGKAELLAAREPGQWGTATVYVPISKPVIAHEFDHLLRTNLTTYCARICPPIAHDSDRPYTCDDIAVLRDLHDSLGELAAAQSGVSGADTGAEATVEGGKDTPKATVGHKASSSAQSRSHTSNNITARKSDTCSAPAAAPPALVVVEGGAANPDITSGPDPYQGYNPQDPLHCAIAHYIQQHAVQPTPIAQVARNYWDAHTLDADWDLGWLEQYYTSFPPAPAAVDHGDPYAGYDAQDPLHGHIAQYYERMLSSGPCNIAEVARAYRVAHPDGTVWCRDWVADYFRQHRVPPAKASYGIADPLYRSVYAILIADGLDCTILYTSLDAVVKDYLAQHPRATHIADWPWWHGYKRALQARRRRLDLLAKAARAYRSTPQEQDAWEQERIQIIARQDGTAPAWDWRAEPVEIKAEAWEPEVVDGGEVDAQVAAWEEQRAEEQAMIRAESASF